MGFWKDITGVTAANKAAEAQIQGSQKAADAQLAATQLGIDEQRRQFEAMQGNMSPYMQAGEQSLEQQQALSGALGPEAQQAAYDAIQNSAGFQSTLQQGESSILQNAAATGGVRGGNTQGVLAQYSPQLLSQAVDQRYGQLGGITSMGQNAAAGVGNAGMNMGNSISNSMNAMGQAQGQNYMNAGNAAAQNALGAYSLQKSFLGDVAGLGIKLAGLF